MTGIALEIDKGTVVLNEDTTRRYSFAFHFRYDVTGTPLRRNDDHVNQQVLEYVAKDDLLTASGYKAAHFVSVGIDQKGGTRSAGGHSSPFFR